LFFAQLLYENKELQDNLSELSLKQLEIPTPSFGDDETEQTAEDREN
jgi:hypothetical protein